MARGRPEGSKSTTAVTLADLVNYMRGDQTVMVGTTWLRSFEKFHGVKFSHEERVVKIAVMDNPEILEGGNEKEAEVRDRVNLTPEEL